MDGYKVKGEQRAKRQTAKRNAMPQNGVALKRLLIDRAAKAQRTPAEQFEFETRPVSK
jgi:hypothetical protein